MHKVEQQQLAQLATLAWKVRENAYVIGPTKVGCAVLSQSGEIFVGCNVEHRFRSHDVHAEVNAISTMIASGSARLLAAVVVAERERFTPCGACMDWIMQHGGQECVIGFQSSPGADIICYSAQQLMPHYPM